MIDSTACSDVSVQAKVSWFLDRWTVLMWLYFLFSFWIDNTKQELTVQTRTSVHALEFMCHKILHQTPKSSHLQPSFAPPKSSHKDLAESFLSEGSESILNILRKPWRWSNLLPEWNMEHACLQQTLALKGGVGFWKNNLIQHRCWCFGLLFWLEHLVWKARVTWIAWNRWATMRNRSSVKSCDRVIWSVTR